MQKKLFQWYQQLRQQLCMISRHWWWLTGILALCLVLWSGQQIWESLHISQQNLVGIVNPRAHLQTSTHQNVAVSRQAGSVWVVATRTPARQQVKIKVYFLGNYGRVPDNLRIFLVPLTRKGQVIHVCHVLTTEAHWHISHHWPSGLIQLRTRQAWRAPEHTGYHCTLQVRDNHLIHHFQFAVLWPDGQGMNQGQVSL